MMVMGCPNPISYTSSSCTGHWGLRVGAVQGVPERFSLGELRLWGRREPLYLGPDAAQGLNQHASSPLLRSSSRVLSLLAGWLWYVYAPESWPVSTLRVLQVIVRGLS